MKVLKNCLAQPSCGFTFMRTQLRQHFVNAAGFTLIELIIVMVIVGMMAGVFMANFPRMQLRTRDTQRKSDLKQYSAALENYANENSGFYPEATGANVNAAATICDDLFGAGATCPIDPKDGKLECLDKLCRYFYQSDGDVGAGPNIFEEGTRYTLRARMEELPHTLTCVSGVGVYWVICSGGEAGYVCDNTSFSTGICPL